MHLERYGVSVQRSAWRRNCSKPRIFIVSLDLDHALDCEDVSLESSIVFVLNNNYYLAEVILHIIIGNCCVVRACSTHGRKFVSDSPDRAGDVLVQSGVARLKNGRIVFPTPHEQLGGVYAAYIEDGMNCNLNCGRMSSVQDDATKKIVLNSEIPCTISI